MIKTAGGYIFVTLMIFLAGCVQSTDNILAQKKHDIFSLPGNWGDVPVVLLENTTDIELKLHWTNELRRVDTKWFYVNRRNPDLLSTVKLYEYDTYEYPIKIKARAFYPDGGKWSLDPARIKRKRITLSNAVESKFAIPKYKKGTLIHLEVTRRYFHPEFIGRLRLRDRHPALKRTVTFTFPKKCNLLFGIENKRDTSIEESEMVLGKNRIIRYSANNLTDYWPEHKVMLPEDWYTALYFSIPPKGSRSYSWKELGDHYLKLAKDAFDSSPAIKQLSATIISGNRDQVIADCFSSIIKKVRYHADEEGYHAFFPRKASTILDHGYGDCKEISTLLKALLQTKGIESCLALVSTSGHIQLKETYPSLDNFNHMVLCIKDDNGGYRFLDGTQSWAHAGNSYLPITGRKTLLLIPGESKTTRVARRIEHPNRIVTRSNIQKNSSTGQWIIKGQISLYADAALDFFSTMKQSETTQKNSLARLLLQKQFGLEATEVMYDLSNSNLATIHYAAPFQEQYIDIKNGGFKLKIPQLYKKAVNPGFQETIGPRQLHDFSQQDIWVLPDAPAGSRLMKVGHPFAESQWHVNGKEITREYRQHSKAFETDDEEFEIWFTKCQKIPESVVWR